MEPRYLITLIPLDAADDDVRWRQFTDAVRLGFLGSVANDAMVARLRDDARSLEQRLRTVELENPRDYLPGPVATYSSWDGTLSLGGGRSVAVNQISDVTVRASHRRRGLLRSLITLDLAEAKERGLALAGLTASEATIYGRFGFGVASRHTRVEIDCQRFALREPAVGSCEYVTADAAAEILDKVLVQVMARTPGMFGPMPLISDFCLGRFEWESGSASQKMRVIVHTDALGTPDGVASFEPEHTDTDTALNVTTVFGADARVESALWDFLAHIDLVKKIRTCMPWDSPLPWAITDSRAIVPRAGAVDRAWLRILDVPAALQARGWERDGMLVIDVVDPLGLADGRFRMDVVDGAATVVETDEPAHAMVDVETLASLYLGDISALTLASAGRLQGDAHSVARMFSVLERPATPLGF